MPELSKLEKQAFWAALGRGLARLGSKALANPKITAPAAAGTAGWFAAPHLADVAGIETDAGRLTQRLGTAGTWAALASPQVRRMIWRKGGAKAVGELLKKNPNALMSWNKLPAAVTSPSTPIRGALITGGLLSAPTTLGAYTDPAKIFADQTKEKLKTDPEYAENFTPSGIADKITEKYFPKLREAAKEKFNELEQAYTPEIKQKIKDYAVPLSATVGGGALGSGLGYLTAKTLGNVFMPEDSADYKNLDEEGYEARRSRERIKSIANLLGAYAGGAGGALLGRKYLPQLFSPDKTAAAVGAVPGAKAGIEAAKAQTAAAWHKRNLSYTPTKTPQDIEKMRKLKDQTAAYLRSQSNAK